MSKVNCKLKGCLWAILYTMIISLFNGCQLLELNRPKPDNTNIKKDEIKTDKPAASRRMFLFKKSKTKEAPPAEQGSGYLSEGPTLSLGIVDGDEELKVLKKIRILESKINSLKDEMVVQEETSNKKLSELQAAKEAVEKDFADTKKRLENENKDLSDKIKELESKLIDTEARAVAAEKELNPVKKELLKAQLSEIKAQQELYKLKIDNLKKEE